MKNAILKILGAAMVGLLVVLAVLAFIVVGALVLAAYIWRVVFR